MTRDRERGPLVAALALTAALALLALFVFLVLRGPGESELLSRGSPAAPPEIREARRSPPPREGLVTAETPGRAAPPSPEPAASDEPLHAPDLGPRLRRSGSRLEIEVFDSAGGHLESRFAGIEKAALWRRLGDFWLREEARFDGRAFVLASRGTAGLGLEPGEYEAEVSAGAYGVGSARFLVGLGEEARREMRLPGRRRVVTLSFLDEEGRPVPYLHGFPSYEPPASAPLEDTRPRAPGVLRDPPGEFAEFGFGGGASSGYVSRRRRRAGRLLRTDEGRVHVVVVSGRMGRLRLRADDEILDSGELLIESDFTEPSWDLREIRVRLAATYDEEVASRGTTGAEDPGRRSLLGSRAPRPAAARGRREPRDRASIFDPDSISRAGGRRIVADLGGWGELDVYGHPERNGAPEFLGRKEGRLRVIDHSESVPMRITAHDGAALRFEDRVVGPEAPRIAELDFGGGAVPVDIEIVLPPTLAAFARAVGVGFESARLPEEQRIRGCPLRPVPLENGRARLRTALTPSWRAALLDDARLTVALVGAGGGPNYDESGAVRQGGARWTARFDLDELDRRALVEGRLDLDLARRLSSRSSSLLVFRAVGVQDEGLPWVEASVLAAEDEALALEIRKASRDLARRGRRPEARAFDPEPPTDEGDETREAEDSEELALLKRHGERLLEVYGIDGLRRLHETAAWYESRRKLESDLHGYGLGDFSGRSDPDRRLEPGRRYVLYLWSSSRDDLEPDRRLVFEAAPGVTDLGVVELPSYR